MKIKGHDKTFKLIAVQWRQYSFEESAIIEGVLLFIMGLILIFATLALFYFFLTHLELKIQKNLEEIKTEPLDVCRQ